MNIIPRFLRRSGKDSPAALSAIVRSGQPMGAWQNVLGGDGFIPRQVNPHLYEALREAIPVLDGALNRLVTVDGIVRVRGENDALTQEIERGLLENIPVNDAEAGLSAFFGLQGGELYEQGFGVGEMVMDKRGRELVSLRVADSKGMAFSRAESGELLWWYRPPAPSRGVRADGSDTVEAILRNSHPRNNLGGWLKDNDYTKLDPRRMIYCAHMPEADNPYGTSLLRSMEFVSQILLKIQNATGLSWDRFGDPPFQLIYKVKNRAVAGDQKALDKRTKVLGQMLTDVLKAKRSGNSADFVQAIGAEDDIQIQVIGAQDQILEIELPAQHMLEQIVAKTGLPSWMLGFHWSTAERLAKYQSELVLQESRTRFERRLPGLRRIVETYLRGRGLTWKPGDWELYQELPNLHDDLQRAQARFLEAQTALMLEGTLIGQQGLPKTVPGTGADERDATDEKRFTLHPDGSMTFPLHTRTASDAVKTNEGWAEKDPELPKLEARTRAALLAAWKKLQEDTFRVLGLPTDKAAQKDGAVVWHWSPDMETLLRQLMAEFEIAQGSAEGDLVRGMIEAWTRGTLNAAAELGFAAAVTASRTAVEILLRDRGMQMIRTAIHRAYAEDLLAELAQGAYNGESPGVVARRLRRRFGAHEYNWALLATSEIAQAQALGKEAEYAELGVDEYDYTTVGDDRVSEICRYHEANNPHPLGDGPLPMRDSHPGCRCTITAVID